MAVISVELPDRPLVMRDGRLTEDFRRFLLNMGEFAEATSIVYVSAFKRAPMTPPLTAPTGGSFDFANTLLTPPEGWSASIPEFDGNPLWETRTVATAVAGRTVDDTLAWSVPALVSSVGTPGEPGIAVSVTYNRPNIWVQSKQDGPWSPIQSTVDGTVSFRRGEEVVATRVMRGTLNTSTGVITVTGVSSSGEAVTTSTSGSPGASVRTTVTHVASGVAGTLQWTAIVGAEPGDKGEPGTSLRVLGSLASPDDLPAVGQEIGDAYLIGGNLWVWNGTTWENVGSIQGPAAVQLVLNRPAVVVIAYADGNVKSLAEAAGRARLMQGSNDITALATLTATVEGGTATVNTASSTPVEGQPVGYYEVTAMTADVTTVTITADWAGNEYSALFTVTKSFIGYELVTELPTDNLFEGRIVYNTVTKRMYRYTDGEWEYRTPTDDLTGQIIRGQIALGAVDESLLETGLAGRINLVDAPTTGLVPRMGSVEQQVTGLFDTYGPTAAAQQSAADAAQAAADAAQAVIDSAAEAAAAVGAKADAILARQGAETARDLSVDAKTLAETARGQAQTFRDQASSSASTASDAAFNAGQSATASGQARDLADGYASAASTSSQSASGYATDAETAASASLTYRNQAESFRNDAGDSATAASGFASTATTKASEASGHAAAALDWRNQAQTARGEAVTARNEAVQSATDADSARAQAVTQVGLATTARDQAQGFASAASTSSQSASSFADAAEVSASSVGAVVQQAEAARDLAQGHASAASGHASTAAAKATEAGQSAQSAQSWFTESEAQAALSAGHASVSAGHATTAGGHALAAEGWAGASETSSTQAASQVSIAQGWAEDAEDARDLALQYRGEANTFRQQASVSASDADSARSAAVIAQEAAAQSALDASGQVSAASGFASTALAHADTAGGHAVAAQDFRNQAEGFKGEAQTFRGEAATFANTAGGHASAAAISAREVRAFVAGFETEIPYNFDTDIEGFTSSGLSALTVSGGSLLVWHTSTTGFIRTPNMLDFPGGQFPSVMIRLRRTAGSSWRGRIQYSTPTEGETTARSHTVSTNPPLNEWTTIEWDMRVMSSGGTHWVNNTIRRIRIELGLSSIDRFEIDWIAIGRWAPQAYSAAIREEALVRASADDQLLAQYTVKVDVNGYVSGFGLASTAVNGATVSNFNVRADRFAIASPSGPGISPLTPFTVYTTSRVVNGVTIPPGVYMNSAVIDSLNADRITAGDIRVALGLQGSGKILIQKTSFDDAGEGIALGMDGPKARMEVGTPTKGFYWKNGQFVLNGELVYTENMQPNAITQRFYHRNAPAGGIQIGTSSAGTNVVSLTNVQIPTHTSNVDCLITWSVLSHGDSGGAPGITWELRRYQTNPSVSGFVTVQITPENSVKWQDGSWSYTVQHSAPAGRTYTFSLWGTIATADPARKAWDSSISVLLVKK